MISLRQIINQISFSNSKVTLLLVKTSHLFAECSLDDHRYKELLKTVFAYPSLSY